MKMTASTRLVIAMVVIAGLAAAFWMLLLSPKKDEAKKLGTQVTKLEESLSQHRAEVRTAVEAREQFPTNYQQLVVLGKAVPGDDDTPSLLVQLHRIAKRSRVEFLDIKLSEGGGEAPSEESPSAGSTPTSLVPPTEVAASTMPLGASIGTAGLGVMPYELTFTGRFFKLADFIKGLDSLVKTENKKGEELDVNGRLLTINGFSLEGFPTLTGKFSITSYLTPPEQGVTAGATPSGPATGEATPASTTTGGTP
jgi:Tfp pilus assembly protein PilO